MKQPSAPTTIQTVLAEFREAAQSNRDLGDSFERLFVAYLKTDPIYSERFESVWLWGEWPNRWGGDDGIDIVAREKLTGDYCAIQAKFYRPDHYLQKGDIDSFLATSGKRFATNEGDKAFTSRMIVSTTDKWSANAELALQNQTLPVSRIRVQDLEAAPIDWGDFSLGSIPKLKVLPKKQPREHQAEAIEAVVDGFKTTDRGKLIMACGTGKTFTALKLAERTVPDKGLVLFLVPSISLLSQSLREWSAEAEKPFHAFAVCSDTKIGKEQEDISAHDLVYPATTDAKKLALHAQAAVKDRWTVVFSTYQSLQVVADAQKLGLGAFDLIICDEAHRTTGITLAGEDVSDFVKVHSNTLVKGAKRVYMTATPRIYADASKTKADQSSAVLYSMDDEPTFGPEFYRLGFGKAVEKELLADYKVLIVAVDEERMAALANNYNNAFKLGEKEAIDTRYAVRIIGSWKGLSKKGLMLVDENGEPEPLKEDTAPMKRAVAFSRSIKDSKQVTSIFSKVVDAYAGTHREGDSGMVHCQLDHVDGGMNALVRLKALKWLKDDPGENGCRILSNARCLSEGIDVPALDSVVFFDTRESIVDIVQSVGRVMRKAPGKQFGYIILPVGIPSSRVKDYNSYVSSDPQFKSIWKIIKALRAHDDSLVDEAEFRRKIKVATAPDGEGGEGGGEQLDIDFPALPIDTITDAVYAAIPKKLGDREYWSEWAKGVAVIATRLIERIQELLKTEKARKTFDKFLAGLRTNLNPQVTEGEAIEMLAQHILTRPIFEALFAGNTFTQSNPVSKAMQAVIKLLDSADVSSETGELEKFYSNVRERVSLAKSDKSRQDIIKNLYDTFFTNAFPLMAKRLGIVYTPIEVVDFIVHSVDAALRKHFKSSISNEGVQVIDPFTGTGTFLVRLLQSGLIKPQDLERKYGKELHANEIVLLAYYIAALNIESAFHQQSGGSYKPFDGIVLTDTFQMNETGDLVDELVLPENNERVTRQKSQSIKVVMGNPPYSTGQDDANSNAQNVSYPGLEQKIRETYAQESEAVNKNSLYATEVKALRWACDRIGDNGIVAFVTNGAFIDKEAASGIRACLVDECSTIYVFNLRGDQRTSGEASKREGGKIFGSGSRNGIAIILIVKDPAHQGDCSLLYHDIGDYLTQEEKLARIVELDSIDAIQWQRLTPNSSHDWINQRDPAFGRFRAISEAADAIFEVRSRGVETSRDRWVYGFRAQDIAANIKRLLETYNSQMALHGLACSKAEEPAKEAATRVLKDPRQIKWSSGLLEDLCRQKKLAFDAGSLGVALYRPFCKQWLYYNEDLSHRYKAKIFPTPKHENLVISVIGVAERKGFSVLMTNAIPDLHVLDTGQCFPRYVYEKSKQSQGSNEVLFESAGAVDVHGYARRDGVTDKSLSDYRKIYKDQGITKDDIFNYVYGVLHSPEYKQRFVADLQKMLPRIPMARQFWAFSNAGKQLAELHVHYETVDPFKLEEERKRLVMDVADYRVHKMTFGKKPGGIKDKSVIHFNPVVTLRGIPGEAYEYIVNGKSAIECVMEQYAVSVDKESQIKSDPNEWSDDPQYILNLLKRVIAVSVETVKIVRALPKLDEIV